jgi:hypothetical protein
MVDATSVKTTGTCCPTDDMQEEAPDQHFDVHRCPTEMASPDEGEADEVVPADHKSAEGNRTDQVHPEIAVVAAVEPRPSLG